MGQPFLSKMQFSEGTHFLKSTQTVLESSKSNICQKWPEQVLGYVSRSIVSKFDPKSPKGSVPNVQSKFLTRDAIRWFKCKLKPPKNWKRMWFEIIYFIACGSDWFWNSNQISTETTKYFSTTIMHPFPYMVTNNLA